MSEDFPDFENEAPQWLLDAHSALLGVIGKPSAVDMQMTSSKIAVGIRTAGSFALTGHLGLVNWVKQSIPGT